MIVPDKLFAVYEVTIGGRTVWPWSPAPLAHVQPTLALHCGALCEASLEIVVHLQRVFADKHKRKPISQWKFNEE